MPDEIRITRYDRQLGITEDDEVKPFYMGVNVDGEHYVIDDDDWDETVIDDKLKRAYRLTSYDEETGEGTAVEVTDSGLLKRIFMEQLNGED